MLPDFCEGRNRVHIHFYENNIEISKCGIHKDNVIESFTPEKWKNINIYQTIKSYFNNTNKKTKYFCEEYNICCNAFEDQCFDSVEVAISQQCNLNCNMCFMENHKDTNEMKELYFYTLNKLKGHSLKSLRLTDNGEPFFYTKEIIHYLENLTQNDFQKVWCTSNILMLNQEYIQKLASLDNIKFEVQVSLDTLIPERFKIIRSSSKLKLFMENLEQLIKVGLCREVHTVFQKNINDDEFESIQSFCKNYNLKWTYYYLED